MKQQPLGAELERVGRWDEPEEDAWEGAWDGAWEGARKDWLRGAACEDEEEARVGLEGMSASMRLSRARSRISFQIRSWNWAGLNDPGFATQFVRSLMSYST